MLFETEEKANRFIKFNESEIREDGKKKFKKLRSYYCVSCGGWHITSSDLTKKQIKETDNRINKIIDNSKSVKDITQKSEEEAALDYVKKFNLASFGSRKKARKFFSSNRSDFPDNVRDDLVFHVLKKLPAECFVEDGIDIRQSFDNVDDEVNELYSRLPDNLTDTDLINNYIDWEFQYREKVRPEVIIELKKKLKVL